MLMDGKMLVYLQYMDGVTYAKLYGRTVIVSMLGGLFVFPSMAMYADYKGRKALLYFATFANWCFRMFDFLLPYPATVATTTCIGSPHIGVYQGCLTGIA